MEGGWANFIKEKVLAPWTSWMLKEAQSRELCERVSSVADAIRLQGIWWWELKHKGWALDKCSVSTRCQVLED